MFFLVCQGKAYLRLLQLDAQLMDYSDEYLIVKVQVTIFIFKVKWC